MSSALPVIQLQLGEAFWACPSDPRDKRSISFSVPPDHQGYLRLAVRLIAGRGSRLTFAATTGFKHWSFTRHAPVRSAER